MSVAVVISDTDIIGHIINGGIFDVLFPHVIQEIYIPPQVAVELKGRNLETQLFHSYNKGGFIKRTKDEWNNLPRESKQEVTNVKKRLNPELDPGELDCYAYSVGMKIGAIISNDRDARRIITEDSGNQKIVMNFAQLLILGANLGKFSMIQAEEYYEQVKRKNRVNKFADFEYQVNVFNTDTIKHPWVQQNFPSLYR